MPGDDALTLSDKNFPLYLLIENVWRVEVNGAEVLQVLQMLGGG